MNLLILTGLFPPDNGGPATYVPRIAGALENQGFNVEVVTAGTKPAGTDFQFPVHRVPRPVGQRLPRSLPIIRDRLSWADRVYVNGLELDHALGGLLKDVPSVQKIVGDRSWERFRNRGNNNLSIDEFQRTFPGLRAWFERTLNRTITRTCDEFIVPSDYLKSLIQYWGLQPETIHVIHNHSLPPEEIPDREVKWPRSDRNLLCVGRLVPWKKVNELVRTLRDYPEFGLVVLGDGPERGTIEAIVEKFSLENQVILKGNVSRGSVWNHLQSADLLVLNSTYEGFPHVLLESIQSGTPAIARASNGSKELYHYFPDQITLYGETETDLKNTLRDNSNFEAFDPPSLPFPLRWETIVDRTVRVLERAGSIHE